MATTVSALNHPSICTLHDIGEQDGLGFPGDGAGDSDKAKAA